MKFQLVILCVIFLMESSLCSSNRTKRVINGMTWVGRPRNYDAIRYYGVLATAHRTWFTFGKVFDFLKNVGTYGSIFCSGSLLTPFIFQTACHCVAGFNVGADSLIKPPIVNHPWEDRQVVYVGVSNRFGEDSMVTDNYIPTEKFTVHSLCAGIGSDNTLVYDYGLVQIDSNFVNLDDRKYHWLEIKFQPAYTTQDITQFYQYAISKELVCLILGFGRYSDDPDASYVSDHLRHGWNVLAPLHICWNSTQTVIAIKGKKRFLVNIPKELLNWVCARPFPKNNQYTGSGDSGSPLSCNNKYFGVLSALVYTLGPKGEKVNIMAEYGSLVKNLFVNSVNYRSKFLYVFYRLGDTYVDPSAPNNHSTGGRGFEKISPRQEYRSSFTLSASKGQNVFALRFLLIACAVVPFQK